MNTYKQINGMQDRSVILSTLWIFALVNYLYCDVVSLMDPGLLPQYLAGNVGGIHITPGFLLAASILMEIPISMILLSRVLKYRANRWLNIVAGSIMTVVQASSLTFGASPTAYYLFFSAIEIASTAFIVWYAWKWTHAEGETQTDLPVELHQTLQEKSAQ